MDSSVSGPSVIRRVEGLQEALATSKAASPKTGEQKHG